MMKYIPNILPYSGAKIDLLDNIIPVIPKTQDMILCDVFGGSGAVAVNFGHWFPGCKVHYNEFDPMVYETIKAMRDTEPDQQIEFFETTIKQNRLNDTNEGAYYFYRDHVANPLLLEGKGHLHNVVLTRHAFSSTPRWGGKGNFNNPFGHRTWTFTQFWRFMVRRSWEIYQNVEMSNMSFEEFVDRVLEIYAPDNRRIVFYFDPPYLITAANYNNGWNEDMERLLLGTIDHLVEKGHDFILSNVVEHRGQTNHLLKEWLKSYNVKYIDKNYNLSRESKCESASKEVLITSLDLPKAATLEDFL